MKDSDSNQNAGAGFAEAPGSETRWAARGDYVETELSGGNIYRVKVETPEACAEANRLIALGRWRVSPNAALCDGTAKKEKP